MLFRSAQHAETQADLTIATIPVPRDSAQSLGILQINNDCRIVRFVEKPKDPAVLDSLQIPRESYDDLDIEGSEDFYLASMGIYVFNRSTMVKLLDNDFTDFGKHIIPGAISSHRVFSYVYQGYWEDIGTIKSFFEANLDGAEELPKFNFFDMSSPIYTRPRFLPGSKINGASIDHAIVSDGCIISHAHVSHSVIGVRSFVGIGTNLHRVIMMGADYYESQASMHENLNAGRPRMGIGQHCRIENTILDKNVRVGDNCVISPAGKPENFDGNGYVIRDGIVIVPKNGVIPHGTVI